MQGRNKHAVAIAAMSIATAAAPPDQHHSERSTRSRATWLSNVRHKHLAAIPALAALALAATSPLALAQTPSAVTSKPAPTAAFTVTTGPNLARSCIFVAIFRAEGSVAAAGTSITQYAWSFGNGNSRVTTTPQAFQGYAPGSYDVTLTVTDSDGQSASTSRIVSGTYPASMWVLCHGR
jgi:hypothetical protein